MNATLTPAGYEQTKLKLTNLEKRLHLLGERTDLSPQHQEESRRSFEQMIAQYRREMKLYEATHPQAPATQGN